MVWEDLIFGPCAQCNGPDQSVDPVTALLYRAIFHAVRRTVHHLWMSGRTAMTVIWTRHFVPQLEVHDAMYEYYHGCCLTASASRCKRGLLCNVELTTRA